MVKYPVSDKTSSYSVKPHITEGFYPGKLISVKEYKDSDGNWIEGKWGHQLIFEFMVYEKDPKTGAPVKPMTYLTDPKDESSKQPVIIPNFVYHEYKSKKNPGEYQTAFTPNSAITRLMKHLGWEFSTEGVDPEKYIGNWVKLIIGDYEQEKDGETITASTIKDIEEYKGTTVEESNLPKVEKREPKKFKKVVKHAEVEKFDSDNPEIKELQEKLKKMEGLNKEGLLTDDGLKQSREQIEAKIKELGGKE